jgi:hypothetical protein
MLELLALLNPGHVGHVVPGAVENARDNSSGAVSKGKENISGSFRR